MARKWGRNCDLDITKVKRFSVLKLSGPLKAASQNKLESELGCAIGQVLKAFEFSNVPLL